MHDMLKSSSSDSEIWSHMRHLEVENELDWKQGKDRSRSQFNNQLQFWFSCLGFAVGYGNIWRFPYMLYTNGGGVFFIPFITWIFIIVYPLFYLEVAYGTVYRRLMDRIFEPINSKFIGVSFGINIILLLEAVLYMCLLGWWWNFFIFSFQFPLPWSVSDNDATNGRFWNENYFRDDFLRSSSGLYDINTYVPWLMFSFIIAGVLTFICIIKGIDSVKYAVYIVIPLPYIILLILFVKGKFHLTLNLYLTYIQS